MTALYRTAITLVLFLHIISFNIWSQEKDYNTLSGFKGADMTLFDRYRDNIKDDYSTSMEYAEMFMSRIDSSSAHPVLGIMAEQLSSYYEDKKDIYSKALDWQFRALEIYTALEDESNIAKSQYNIARQYYRLGQFHKTLEYTAKALSYYESNGIENMFQLECYNLNGVVYSKINNTAQAELYFNKLAEGSRRIKDSTRLLSALNNLAFLSGKTGDSLKSEKLLDEAARICEKTGDTALMAYIYLNVAITHIISYPDSGKAEKYIKLAEPLLINQALKGKYHWVKSEQFIARGKDSSAIEELEKALQYYNQGELVMEQINCYSSLMKLYKKVGDSTSYYKTLADKAELESQISPDKMYQELIRHQSELMDSQKAKTKKEQKSLHISYWGLSIGILLAVCACAFIYIRLKNRKIHMRERELDEKQSIQEALEIKKMELFHSERVNNEIVDKLSKIRTETKDPRTREELIRLCMELSNSHDDRQWTELNHYIPGFNSTFYQNLLKEFPDLTVNERRLCVFLNMNLTTKEISEITRQSINSINAARTRLRNKLGLKGDNASIQEFLSKYNQPEQ